MTAFDAAGQPLNVGDRATVVGWDAVFVVRQVRGGGDVVIGRSEPGYGTSTVPIGRVTKVQPAAATPPADSLRERLAALAGVTPEAERTQLTADILDRARWAVTHNDGHPSYAWSTGEQLAVALVLNDAGHLTEVGCTALDAISGVAGGMYHPPADPAGWLAGIRAQLTAGPEGDDRA